MLEPSSKPLIVQSDMTLLLNMKQAGAEEAAGRLLAFAELVKRPGGWHTYRMTAMTLWQACASGMAAEDVIALLMKYASSSIPGYTEMSIRKWMGRYGKLHLEQAEDKLMLSGSAELLAELALHPEIGPKLASPDLAACLSGLGVEVRGEERGLLKQELARLGYPVIDQAGYHAGEALKVQLREVTRQGKPFELRAYQQQAVDVFCAEGSVHGGSGVVVLPCGAGKTVVGLAALAKLSSATLILTSSTTSVQQWKRELLDKTTLLEEHIGEYAGGLKQVRPVTIATYQILTSRKAKSAAYQHMNLFSERDWGLIIYDEVHLLPAPVFRMTADIQATRRLGLTATLVREDGCAEDVFSLIGPKQYEWLWKAVEAEGHIAAVHCTEIRIPLGEDVRTRYAAAAPRSQLRLAAENPSKASVIRELLKRHEGVPTLIIGQYLDQLHAVAEALAIPVITGELEQDKRQLLYDRFRSGEVPVLAVSRVANFAVDLPDAAVAIQISGSYGSRQEEAQRIGRILRPKQGRNEAWFYTVVSDGTKELDFALRRQLFMVEQGYRYALESREAALLE
ncbi:DNA repair helicase XPB [Paenibacillus sp. Leaf72]|uniref:DNA repair helicase XPB n=1 Tax=Paenibacillus sp. Leaf72 TaxID=1736234 RepID=UPI000700F90D|nr:DNA repair helicase XPB [Paenibacillus sp. Leaf72]KQO04560.1 helicase [Paenibacillus sp. Leaf72]